MNNRDFARCCLAIKLYLEDPCFNGTSVHEFLKLENYNSTMNALKAFEGLDL